MKILCSSVVAMVAGWRRYPRILSNHEIFGLAATVFWNNISIESPHLSFSTAFVLLLIIFFKVFSDSNAKKLLLHSNNTVAKT